MDNILEVKNILEQVGNTSSRNEKEFILEQNKNNELLQQILYFVFNPYILTGLSSKKISKDTNTQPTVVITTILELFDYLNKNNSGRDIDIINVHGFIYKYDKAMQDFYIKLVTKSLKIGIT